MRYEHGNPARHAEVRGRSSVTAHLREVARSRASWEFSDVRIFPTLRDNVWFAQFDAAGAAADGTPAIAKTVVLMLELRGDELVRIVEFANPAMGLATPSRVLIQ